MNNLLYYYSLSFYVCFILSSNCPDGPAIMTVLSLFPTGGEERPLEGLYLGLNLHRQAEDGDLLIYSNYISSLDGRISLTLDHSGESQVPEAIINGRDWRLYQELAAQSDVMITSARYFRQLAKGQAQDLLPVGQEPAYADLNGWRESEGLKAQPDVVIISNSLDIPVGSLAVLKGRRILIFTGKHAEASKVDRLEAAGAELFVMDGPEVSGAALKAVLIALGYRSAYMIAGPLVHRTLIADRVLNLLFLTTRLRLIGGAGFDTILGGDIGGAVEMHLRSLYLDRNASNAQFFAQYALQQG
ncbi:Pyrimidine reductase, riboflavin biosynthesis [Mariprofundus aestuarium]|uniref:Pyrimidine reductase, riboflavin biosynthesis n=1 Tax=Mariprofundus aestuarium TaxID=1921086 RepID=A0A2K8L2M6_MARES|nr:dihydrofolate reductase family protein [Mariprofundus aestuarium]ATX79214.1 Pyrimidine reductase, riboflavin biosynthesis [Mariprofundus aestuarium]